MCLRCQKRKLRNMKVLAARLGGVGKVQGREGLYVHVRHDYWCPAMKADSEIFDCCCSPEIDVELGPEVEA